MTGGRLRQVPVHGVTEAVRELVLQPDEPARAALATRLGLPAVLSLTCTFLLSRNRAGTVVAKGLLDAVVVQEDVTTLEPFEAVVREPFALRFLPEEKLAATLDPDDPEDEVGYAGGVLDLEAVMAEQLALVLDPYPRASS